MKTSTKHPPDTCRITIRNEVTGETKSKCSPCPMVEAMDVDGDVELAGRHIVCAAEFDNLGVCIHQHERFGIKVHWFVIGDPDAAREEWEELIDGPGRAA